MAAPGERGLLLRGAQRGATHKICTSQWFHKVQVTPAPFVKPPLSQPCILVIIIISTLTVSIMGTLIIECTPTRTLLWFGHGYCHHRVHTNTNGSIAWAWMLLSSSALEHERYYGLGMDALVTVLLEHERHYGWDMDALNIECTRTRTFFWLGHGCSYHGVHSNAIVILVWAWMLSSLSALENNRCYGSDMDALKIKCIRTRSLLWFGHGCWLSSSSALENDRHYGSGMGALVDVCSWNANVIMVWTWMLLSSMHSNTNVIMVWTWMLLSSSALEHERYYGLDIDALVRVCCWKRHKIADASDDG